MRQHTTRDPKQRRATIVACVAGFACVAVLCVSLAISSAWGTDREASLLEEASSESDASCLESSIVIPLFANERKLLAAAEAMSNARSERISEAQEASDKPEEDALAEDGAESDGASVTSLVQELLQYPELPAGCESVALTCVLNAMGYDVAATEIVESYLSIDPTYSDPNSFLGDPYTGGYAFPSAIIATANAYLADVGSSAYARDASGSTFDELLQTVEAGTPVLVWSTMYFTEPTFTGSSVGPYLTYYNEHCVVLYGFTEDVVYVSDPLEGLVERDRAEFQRLYEACGALAVVIEQ